MTIAKLCVLMVLASVSIQSTATAIPQFYHLYATKHGVPVEVFFSVMKTESGRTFSGRYLPWPWTLNVNHKAYYYDNKRTAVLALQRFLQNPKNKIAVGLGQIYLPAHGKKFKNPLTLLDPHVNLDFAAQLLKYEFNRAKKKAHNRTGGQQQGDTITQAKKNMPSPIERVCLENAKK